MKRLSLVLFVCLSLQMNVASAPFVHLHTAETYGADHHDGPVVHRHLPGHDAGRDDHQADSELLESHAGDGSASVETSAAAVPIAITATSATSAGSTTVIAPPAIALGLIVPSEPIPPDDDVGDRIPTAPDLGASSLRGPPR